MNRLRVANWNVEDNGRTETLRKEADGILAEYEPNVVFRQELPGAHLNGRAILHDQANPLGLTPFMCMPRPDGSQRPVGVMVDPTMFDVLSDDEFHISPWKPAYVVKVRLRGTNRAITLASAHLSHDDPAARRSAAGKLAGLADHGEEAIVGMDANSYPLPSPLEAPLPDLSTITDPAHQAHRSVWRDGRFVPDTWPDEIMSGAHRQAAEPGPYVDLARQAAYNSARPDADALTPTASLTRTDQGPRQRIDRIYATPGLARAVVKVTVLDGEAVSALTDHALVIADLDLDLWPADSAQPTASRVTTPHDAPEHHR